MKRIHWTIVAVFAAALVAASGTPAGTDAKQVPFHAEIDYTAAPSANSAPCPATKLRVDIAVSDGVITHLGRITSRDYYACLDVTTLEFDGRYVFVAANGDTISAAFAGKFVPTADPGILAIDAHWSIDGGTGRFAGATGSGTASGSGTPSSGHFSQDGMISAVGSAS